MPRGGGAHAKKVEENVRSVEEEVQLLQQFDHANIVRYLVSPGAPEWGGGQTQDPGESTSTGPDPGKLLGLAPRSTLLPL